MGSSNGTYVPWHEPVWGHAKTKGASAVLVAAGVPPEYAPLVAGRALHALSCWALRDGDTGATGRLSDAELAQVAWPEGVAKGRWKPARIGAMLREALHSGGLLVDPGPDERIHDFQDHNRKVLFDRDRRRKERCVHGPSADTQADSPRTVHGQSMDRPRLARASGIPASRQSGNPALPDLSGTSTDGSLSGPDPGRDGTEAGELLLASEPNAKRQPPMPDGRSRTLERGSVYLNRLYALPEPREAQRWLDAHHDSDPPPGRLLRFVAPEAFAVLEAQLRRRAAGLRNPRAYARTALAECWSDVLGRLADQGAARHRSPRLPAAAHEPAAAAPEAPERGYAVPPHVLGCSPLRPSWRTVGRPGPRRRSLT